MPSYRFNSKYMAYAKECSCCKAVVVGTKNEDESLNLFKKEFAESNGKSQTADRLQSRCRACNQAKRRQLGITLDWLREMHKQQEGCCAICAVPISLDLGSTNPANVDHCEKTDTVRQLLCGNCNRGIGLFFHNPEILEAAALYCRVHGEDSE